MDSIKLKSSIVVIIFLGIVGYAFYYKQTHYTGKVTNFAECVQAGYPVRETSPRECIGFNGAHFVENQTNNDTGVISENGTVSGVVTIGPICPVQTVGRPCNTPPDMYTSREVVVYDQSGGIVSRIRLDELGKYTVTLPPGTYSLDVVPWSGINKSVPKQVVVFANQNIGVDFNIDTGIR